MNITILFTGGTIGSRAHVGGIGTDSDAKCELLHRYRLESGDETVFKTAAPYTILSENLTLTHLVALAHAVADAATAADAVIVTLGTDTLPFVAAALSYIRGLSGKPFVLVSSNYVLDDKRANGVCNFRAAVDFLRATRDACGVYVSSRNTGEPVKLLRASRLLSHLAPTDTVYTLNGTVAVWENGSITQNKAYKERADEQPPLSADDLEKATGRVLFLRAHPAMQYPALSRDTAAVLMETYHSGTLPTATKELQDFSASARAKGIPLFAVGITGEATYESANLYPALGITPLSPLSPVAAYMKLLLAVANGIDLKTALSHPLGGDM